MLGHLLEDMGEPGQLPGLALSSSSPRKDIFSTKRKAWGGETSKPEPRCDFADNRHSIRIIRDFYVACRWKKSLLGPAFSEIKSDPGMIHRFADGIAYLIRLAFPGIKADNAAIVSAPARRHREHNFTEAVCSAISGIISIPYTPGIVGCRSNQRIDTEFHLEKPLPEKPLLIVVDDIVTTGSTMLAIYRLMMKNNASPAFFAGINNIGKVNYENK